MGGGTLGANTESITGAHESAKRQYQKVKREKIDEQTRAGQDRFGQVTGDIYDKGMEGMTFVGEKGQEVTGFVNRILGQGGDGDDDVGSDTSEANYSSSGQTQTSSGSGKKADLSDTDKKSVQGASKQLTVKKKKKAE